MNTRNPVDSKYPHAAGDTYSTPKARPQRRPLGSRIANKRSAPSKDQKSPDASALTAVAGFDGKSTATTGAAERVEYKGYALTIEPHRGGWKIAIFPNGSPFALHRIPRTTDVAGRDLVVEQAKAIVDEAIVDNTLQEVAVEPAESSEHRSVPLVAFFPRIRGSLSSGWTALKRAYYSVDQPATSVRKGR
jgi:hypothetical protein